LVAALSLLAQHGVAQASPQFHQGPWPIHNGFNHQPTQSELRALHRQDVTPDEAGEIDHLYDQLLSGSEIGKPQVTATLSAPSTLSGKMLEVSSRARRFPRPPTHPKW
jgi:hypothetical protein